MFEVGPTLYNIFQNINRYNFFVNRYKREN